MKESEQVDTFYNDKTLLSNNELEKELLLDNPSNINIDTKQTKNSFLSPSNEMDESNNFINTMNKHNNNQNSQIDINKDNKFKGKRASPSLKKEDNFEKNLLYKSCLIKHVVLFISDWVTLFTLLWERHLDTSMELRPSTACEFNAIFTSF